MYLSCHHIVHLNLYNIVCQICLNEAGKNSAIYKKNYISKKGQLDTIPRKMDYKILFKMDFILK